MTGVNKTALRDGTSRDRDLRKLVPGWYRNLRFDPLCHPFENPLNFRDKLKNSKPFETVVNVRDATKPNVNYAWYALISGMLIAISGPIRSDVELCHGPDLPTTVYADFKLTSAH